MSVATTCVAPFLAAQIASTPVPVPRSRTRLPEKSAGIERIIIVGACVISALGQNTSL